MYDLRILFAACVSKILCLVVLKRRLKVSYETLSVKLLREEVEKSHPSSKRAEYVLRLLSAQCNTFSVWRV